MRYSKHLKSKLNDVIVGVSMDSNFIRNPKKDFTRNRKLDFITTFNTILTMGGNSLDYEMLELFNYGDLVPTASAFVQARDKILPSTFSHVFNEFTHSLRRLSSYKGYRLISVDGSVLPIAYNPNDIDSYIVTKKNRKGYNQLLLTTSYDLMNNLYTNAVIQPYNKLNERGALIDMIPSLSEKSIVVLDRGYESYNIFAHLDNAQANYVMRVKDITSNGILSGFSFDDKEFDETITVNVSNFHRKHLKSLPNYRFSPTAGRFDFSSTDNPVCSITFRVLRFKLHSGTYESIITNLPSHFEPEEIRHLYKLRWGIETSFRQLKYAVGLSNFHAKKKDSIIQEIYARLTLYNFCESIVQNEVLINLATTHDYKINFTRAVQICRKYLRFFNTIFVSVEVIISKYLSPIRKNRSFTRNLRKKRFTSFIYRVS